MRVFSAVLLAAFLSINGFAADADKKVPEDKDIKVTVTPSGSKYHLADCRTITEGTGRVAPLEGVKKANLEACAVCKPDALVVVTPTGAKYHTETCKSAGKDSVKMILAAARTKGLEACKLCNPPDGKAEKP
ncbi:MAG TPA: hypothetical protein VEK08_04575 [Planctomycetota bacterium]|nr:hypothetical protein [Planctomycetota bacterium]